MILERIYRHRTLRLLSCILMAAFALAPGLAHAAGGFYQQVNLVSDLPNIAPVQDANLVNPWGLSHSATSPWWVSDNGTGLSTLYNGSTGAIVPLVVTIPPPRRGTSPATPTGNIFNSVAGTSPQEFVVSADGKSGPSRFIFATEDGTISGWNPQVDGTHAILAADRSRTGAVYKGLAMGRLGDQDFLYATNFHAGRIDMFDAQFHFVRTFSDVRLAHPCPVPGQCFAPFGIQNIGGLLYVTFALQLPNKHDDAAGPGNGFVDVFDTNGTLLRRLAERGTLNSPWGLALAPQDFGQFSGALLVGNFGDGRINAFDPMSGAFLGQLQDAVGQPITIDGLWGIAFGNDGSAGLHNELFFSAGLNDEADGLFGKIVAGS